MKKLASWLSIASLCVVASVIATRAQIVNRVVDQIIATTCTNQFVRSVVASGAGTCASVAIGSDVSGLGTGVATALGIAVGSAGGPVTNGGALGTPLSGVATNLTSIPVANATGILPAANGGAGTINGALKGNGSGTVSQAACASLSDATGACSATYTSAGSWTPADGSGASLTFTGVSSSYTRIGNMVFAYAQLTYPSTADASAATVSGLPVTVANASYARQCFLSYRDTSTLVGLYANSNATTIALIQATGATVTNLQMSGKTIAFNCVYPVS